MTAFHVDTYYTVHTYARHGLFDIGSLQRVYLVPRGTLRGPRSSNSQGWKITRLIFLAEVPDSRRRARVLFIAVHASREKHNRTGGRKVGSLPREVSRWKRLRTKNYL